MRDGCGFSVVAARVVVVGGWRVDWRNSGTRRGVNVLQRRHTCYAGCDLVDGCRWCQCVQRVGYLLVIILWRLWRYLLAKPRRNTHSRCFLLRKIETNASTFNFLLIFVYEISSNLYSIPSFRPNFYTMCNLNKIIRRANCSTYFRGGHNLLVTQSFLCWNIPISSGTRVFIRYLSKISLFHPALKRNLVFCSVYFLWLITN